MVLPQKTKLYFKLTFIKLRFNMQPTYFILVIYSFETHPRRRVLYPFHRWWLLSDGVGYLVFVHSALSTPPDAAETLPVAL